MARANGRGMVTVQNMEVVPLTRTLSDLRERQLMLLRKLLEIAMTAHMTRQSGPKLSA